MSRLHILLHFRCKTVPLRDLHLWWTVAFMTKDQFPYIDIFILVSTVLYVYYFIFTLLSSTFFWHYSFGLYLLAVSLELLVAYELSRLTCHAACRSAAATT